MAFMRYDYRALPQGETTVEEFRAWLAQFDADGDGRISREELREALRSLDLWFAWWKAREALRDADANRNGLVDPDEMGRLYAFARRNLHLKMGDLQEGQLDSF
jgi:Ca2+-binding EF-hand superfamily protein